MNAEILKQTENSIRERSRITYGVEGNVNYYGNETTPVEGYSDAKLYATQVSIGFGFSANFMLKDRMMVCYRTDINEEKIDRESYDRYGGIMYIYKPMTEEIANLILKIHNS